MHHTYYEVKTHGVTIEYTPIISEALKVYDYRFGGINRGHVERHTVELWQVSNGIKQRIK